VKAGQAFIALPFGGCTRRCARRRPALLRRKTRYLHPCRTGADPRSRYRREGGPAHAVSTNRGTKPRDDRARCVLPEISKRQMLKRHPTTPSSPWSHAEAAFRLLRVASGRTRGGCRDAPAPSAKPFMASTRRGTRSSPRLPVVGASTRDHAFARRTIPCRNEACDRRFPHVNHPVPRAFDAAIRSDQQVVEPGIREPFCQVLPSPAHDVSCIR